MGLFDAFKKKNCDICGGEIGLLGNRKLEDGNMCKHCARKLSPWFDERRHSTIAQINQQLAYREENREKLSDFHVTRVLGESTCVYLDEDAGLFLVTNEAEKNWYEANPDILPFADVTGCSLDIDESKTELTREDSEGNEISYNPPRYRYEYDFNMVIKVCHPYFDDMCFQLNSSNVSIDNVMGARPVRFGTQSGFNPESNVEYRHYKEMGEEIKEALLTVRREAREEAKAAAAPKVACTCPWCGATTTPDANGCCEYCGGSVNS